MSSSHFLALLKQQRERPEKFRTEHSFSMALVWFLVKGDLSRKTVV